AKSRIADALRAEVWPLLNAGTIGPVMDQTFPLDQAAEAHARMEAGDHIGKITLSVGARAA
ncbi:MAG: zinc-binding dehydrogenase, partial [Pseudomonadota bacterium]